jgi:hypothetical protein
MDDIPSFVPLWLRCDQCHAAWNAWQPSYVPIDVWVAHIRALRCPHCGNGPRRLKILDRQPSGS